MFDPLARSRSSFANQAFLRLLGATMDEIGEGRCIISAPLRPELTQQQGFGHAGVATTLADSAAGYAAYTMMPEGTEVLTSEFKVNLLRPAAGDRLIANAKVLKPGRTLTIAEAEIWAETGPERKMVAKMLATMVCVKA